MFCLLLVLGVYFIKDNNQIVSLLDNIGISNLINNKPFIYTNNYKVNKLQLSNADFYFNKLTDNQKKIYSYIALNISTLEKQVLVRDYIVSSDSDIVSQDVNTAISYFLYDHPEVFYLKTDYNISIRKNIFSQNLYINLEYDVKGLDELNSKINEIDFEISKYVNLINEKNDFDKQLFLHDTIIKDIDYYDFGENINNIPQEYHNVYNSIVKKSAVCDGLTKTMQIVLDKVGIQSLLITGVLDQVPHAWNMVKINGNWYHMDITSNKYVKKENSKTTTIAHTYFNVTTEYIMKTHKIDTNDIPVSDKFDDNYYIKTNTVIKEKENFKDRIKDVIKINSNRNCIEFSIDYDKNIVNELSEVLYDLNFNNYQKKGNKYTFKYYNFLNTYIVEKE
jgi:transglutaminase/protease-like cytokinesis protein 3